MDPFSDNELNHYPWAYDPGHFHRVYASEVFNNRYRVYRKLGFGASSTVWLVKDISTGRWHAMKVLSAMCYGGESDLYELEILQHLHSADPSHPGYNSTLQLLDHFDHPGTGGLHRCLIFPVMGESLATYLLKFANYCIPGRALKRIAHQLLSALNYAHSNGVIHTDIKPDNIMIKMTNDSVIDEWFMPSTEGCTEPEALEPEPDSELSFLFWPNSDRLHPSEVPCIPLANYYLGRHPGREACFNVDVVLSDWGVATWADVTRRRTDDVVPLTLRSPELLLQSQWNEKVDIWALGCVIFDLAEARQLFTGMGPCGHGWDYHPEFHLTEIVELFGDIPIPMLEAGNSAFVSNTFDAHGKLFANRPNTCPPLLDWIQHSDGLVKREFLDLMLDMLALDPVTRASADHLLHAAWFMSPEERIAAIAPGKSDVETVNDDVSTLEVKIDFGEGTEVGVKSTPPTTVTTGLSPLRRDRDVEMEDVDLSSEKLDPEVLEKQLLPVGFSSTILAHGDVHDGHIRKKVKLTAEALASLGDDPFVDRSASGAENGVPPYHGDLDSDSHTVVQLPVSTLPTPAEPASVMVDGTALDMLKPFLGVSEDFGKPEPRLTRASRSPELPYWAQLVCGGLWFAKELLSFCVSRF